jgi:DNA-binding response OmpR family regulator
MVTVQEKTKVEQIRVLIVDDDDNTLSFLKCLLRTKNVRIYNQKEGLFEIIKDFDPHVIVLDYHLQDGTAIDILKEVYQFLKKCIPVVFTGMKLSESEKTQLYNNGAMNIISKPCQISTIESIIENYYEISLKYRS